MKIFNTSLEIGLRSIFLIAASGSNLLSFQRIVYYDYLIVHSSDVKNGPQSLHPSIPHRSGEWLIKRDILKSGLKYMMAKQIVEKKFLKEGIFYGTTKLTLPFLEYFKCDYADKLEKRSQWIVKEFNNLSDDKLSTYMNENVDKWGAEFHKESILRG